MNNNKGIKYYLVIFIVSFVFVIGYGVIISIREGAADYAYLASLLTVPFAFTGFLILFDFLLSKILPKKLSEKKLNEYDQFVIDSTTKLNEHADFSIEDFRRLRSSERFQRSLKILYKISTEGESEDANNKMISKRFKKDSLEYKAIKILLEK